MALPTFNEGFFQVTALSFSPSVVAVGETATMSITIKNVSGKSITKCYVDQDGRYPSTNYQYGGAFPSQFLYGGGGSSGWDMKTISWANNVSHTFTATVSFKEGYYHLDATNYVLDPTQTYIHISVVTNATFSGGGNYDNLYIRPDGTYLSILSARDNPKVTLDIERTPNDEAIAVKTTAKLTADVDSSVLTAHGYSIKMYATNAHNPALPTDSAITFNATIANLIAGITDSTSAITTTFSAATDWYFLLTVSNGYETTSAYGSIPRAFANIHLAGLTTGGVAFGKFSSSTAGNPKFECEYPALFNGGIEEVGINWQTLTVASGITTPYSARYGGGELKIGKVGSHVYITGSILGKSGATITTLPEGFRPVDGNKYFLKSCSGARIARIMVTTAGLMSVEWLRAIKDAAEYTTAIWIDCNIDFWIRD